MKKFTMLPARGCSCLLAVLAAFLMASCTNCRQTEEADSYMKLYGPMGERFEADRANWLLTAPYANPGMIHMYFRRNLPHQGILPWYGEFTGKYLTSATLSYAMQPDERLKNAINYVIDNLAKAQDSDGYLGVWPDKDKLSPQVDTWDCWSHYHNMLGLLNWYNITGNEQAKDVLLKAADCLYNSFCVQHNSINLGRDFIDASIGHIFALMYQQFKDPRYLEMVNFIFDTFALPGGADYLNKGLQGVPYYEIKGHNRWEGLHPLETISEMYRITGEEKYRTAFQNLWNSITQYDRHSTGAFSSGEEANGNPFDCTGSIETCCSIAYLAISADLLDIAGSSRVADELELTTWNTFLGAQHASGHYCTYDTPMSGERRAGMSGQVQFQARAGSGELNCCSVNESRGFGLISQWGLKATDECLTINYYGASETRLQTPQGNSLTVAQTGGYPFDKDLRITVSTQQKFGGKLRLRIPFWSELTKVKHNGRSIADVKAGEYLEIDQVKSGDTFDLEFDMRPHFWQGDRDLTGKTAIYYGPILLTCDERFDFNAYSQGTTLQLSSLKLEPAACADAIWPQPYLLLKATDGRGNSAVLCDFATAGQTGSFYTSWMATEPELTATDCLQPWGERLKQQ